MAKTTNPKDAALESDVLKAAGNAPAPVNQQDVKDQAQAIADQANKAGAETVQGIPANMTGQPAQGTQLQGSGLPPVASTQAAGAVDPEYAEFLAWKKKKEDSQQALAQASADLPGQPVVDEYEAKRRTAEEAARKAYNDVMDGQAQAGDAVVDQSENTDATALHKERLRLYGDGYVVARRQGVEQVFTRQTWKLLGGRNNKDGYTEVVATPPEIANLKKAQ